MSPYFSAKSESHAARFNWPCRFLYCFLKSATSLRLRSRSQPTGSYASQPESFHLWMPLPAPWTRQAFVAQLQACGIGVVSSDSFWVPAQPPEAVRVCIGGISTHDDIQHALQQIDGLLRTVPAHTPAVV